MKRDAVEAVIFDLDGTLIDSIPLYFWLLDTVFDRHGLPRASRKKIAEAAREEEFRWDLVLPRTPGKDKAALVADVSTSVREMYPEMLKKDLQMIPGAASVLEGLTRRGIKIGMVTSTPSETMLHKWRPLREAGVDALFAAVITADDAKRKKPHAEPLLACAGRLKADPLRCVYVGDSGMDIRAGKAAGMKTVGVLTGFDDRSVLEREGADAVLESVTDLPGTLALWDTAGRPLKDQRCL